MEIKDLHIPLSQLLKFELNTTEMIVYGVILYHAYKGNCTTTNKTLAKEVGITERTITTTLKTLDEKKCIKVEYIQRDRYQLRKITPLVLFDLIIAPNNYRESQEDNENGGFRKL